VTKSVGQRRNMPWVTRNPLYSSGLEPHEAVAEQHKPQTAARDQRFAQSIRLRIPSMGQPGVMGKLIRRSTILTAALAPIAALSLVTPAASSAQPLDCQNGEWWDPVANVCQPPLVPFPPNCGDGQYWNPVSNACRPLGQV
jgi:hypothetical protein